MARDTSPIVKQSRREGYALHPKAHKILAKKTRYSWPTLLVVVRANQVCTQTQLREKQKVRRTVRPA